MDNPFLHIPLVVETDQCYIILQDRLVGLSGTLHLAYLLILYQSFQYGLDQFLMHRHEIHDFHK